MNAVLSGMSAASGTPWTPSILVICRRSSLDGDPLNAGVVGRTKTHQFRIVFERVVNDPAIVRIHRFKFDGASGQPDGIGNLAYTLAKFIVSHRPPVGNINLHPRGASISRLQDSV